MVRVAAISAYVLFVISPANAACNYVSDRSVVFADNTKNACEAQSDSASKLTTDTLHWSASQLALDKSEKNYWDQWAYKKDYTTMLTKNLQKNHFGLGLWMPEDLMEEENEMQMDDWLLNHGLMLSVGFGNKSDGEPRMRLDYRWHDYYDADWMMQIELPF